MILPEKFKRSFPLWQSLLLEFVTMAEGFTNLILLWFGYRVSWSFHLVFYFAKQQAMGAETGKDYGTDETAI